MNLWKQHPGCVPDSIWKQSDMETLVLADNDLTEFACGDWANAAASYA